jgi:flagellar basal-body rod protein FlgG
MLEGLRTAAAGMVAQQQKLDATANDIANASTTGYKHLRLGFKDLLYEQSGRPAAASVQRGTGVAAVDSGRGFEQGSLQPTGNPLDFAIQGDGFFKVRLSDGREALTRDGSLHIDGKGRLTTTVGALVLPPITIPAGVSAEQISIAADGSVLAKGANVGRLQLVNVRSTQGLRSAGDNAFIVTAASGPARPAPATTTLTQGSLEASNTDTAQAMIDLLDSQRTYQLSSKAVQTADSMMEMANGLKR